MFVENFLYLLYNDGKYAGMSKCSYIGKNYIKKWRYEKMNMKIKKVFSMFLALLMVCSVVWTNFTPTTAEAATPTRAASSTSQYGLQDNVQDGLILHCWDWSFNNIAEQMETIAKSGYSAIQTSPIQ